MLKRHRQLLLLKTQMRTAAIHKIDFELVYSLPGHHWGVI